MWFQIKAFFSHSRTILIARLYTVASFIVVAHDYALPFILGQDWTPVTSHFPAWALPLLGVITNILFEWLRHLTTQPLVMNKVDAVIAEAKAEATPTTTLAP